MAYKKVMKKVAKAAGRAAKRRYFKGSGYSKPNVQRMVKDVAYLKSVLNPEKKRVNINTTDQIVGQTNANVSAYYALDITPQMAQGATGSTRNGNSIKLHSSHLRFQFQTQMASNPRYRLKIQVIKVLGQPISPIGNAVTTMLEPNPFVTGGTIYDFYSDRDPENFKQFRVLRTKYLTIQPNQITNVASIANISFGMKYKSHHIKFNSDGSSVAADGQLFLLITCDNGNVNAATASTLNGTVLTAANTGLIFQHDITHFYYDN